MKDYSKKHMKTSIFIDNVGDVECDVKYHWDNDSIGAYEFWGAKCFDHGNNYVKIDDIIPVLNDDITESEDAIVKYIDKHYEAICERICVNFDDVEEL